MSLTSPQSFPAHGTACLFGGTAGEGLESAGEAFSRSLAACGFRPTTQRDFPSRIRGGDTTFTVRLTPQGHLAPPEQIDLAVAFNATVLPRILLRLGPGSLLLVDEGVEAPDAPEGVDIRPFPFTRLAEAAGFKRGKNVVSLGAAAALLGLPMEDLAKAVAEQFAHKGDDVVEQNRQALDAGHKEARKQFGAAPRFPAPAPGDGEALFLSGNEAACLGALAAGCRVAAAYPITPASDILEYLTPRLQQLGGLALQMEDEMAALNLCIGAGFAGARAVTATSGPGLSLMTETLGLAGATETPVVVIDCQRPGPSTGMPTKHGQEDLWHLVHGGHGEWVRVVLAPTDVEDAFHATAEAFRLAARFRTPAFVALDQQCSLFKQTVTPFDLASEAERHPKRTVGSTDVGLSAWAGNYRPYGEHDGRVALPGEPGGRYYANSTEHGPSGFTNEHPEVRDRMVQRRLRRMEEIVAETHEPVRVEEDSGLAGAAAGEVADAGDDVRAQTREPDVVLVSWGSTVEACREARVRLAAHGVDARVVAIRLLWPFPTAQVRQALGTTAPILVVEANAFAQLARLLKSELPVHERTRSVLRYDGTPVRSDDVLAAWREVSA